MARRLMISKPKKRILISIAAILVIATALTGGWIWWTRPVLRSVPLPEGTEPDQVMVQGGSIPPILTTAGTISSAGLRSENREWIAKLRWTDLQHTKHLYELRLGEPVEVEGLGTITLVRVDPVPLFDSDRLSWLPGIKPKLGSGNRLYFTLIFKDGVRECEIEEYNCPPRPEQ